MGSNPNATVAGLTAVLVYLIDRVLKHFGVIDFSPDQVLAVAGGLTYSVLWVGRDGVLGAAKRIWGGAKAAAGVKPPPTSGT